MLKKVAKRIIDKPQSGYLHLSLQVLERQTKKFQVQIHFVISQMPKICFRRFLTVTFHVSKIFTKRISSEVDSGLT